MADKKDKQSLADVIGKIASIGAGGAFLNEENIKNLIGDIPLPKDIVNGLINNAKSAKEDFTKSMRDEFRKYLSKLDTDKIIDHLAENYDVEVNATFSFKKKKDPKA